MEETGRAGIATFVMRDKEYVVAIVAEDGVLRAETLRFADEIRTPEQIGLPKPHEVAKRDSTRVEKSVAKLTARQLDPAELVDEREQRLAQLIAEKSAKDRDVVEVAKSVAGDEETVVDLMERLKQSLRARGQGRGATAKPKRAAGKSRATKPRHAA
jgi:DNA end-binding protein Ku